MHFLLGSEIFLVIMTGKFKTMTLIEEAELDRLRQRQIKGDNPGLNILIENQDQIFKFLMIKSCPMRSNVKSFLHLKSDLTFYERN